MHSHIKDRNAKNRQVTNIHGEYTIDICYLNYFGNVTPGFSLGPGVPYGFLV